MDKRNRGFDILRGFFCFLRSLASGYQKPEQHPCSDNLDLPSISTVATEINTTHFIENPGSDQELFVVWDALGDGRLVGVFSSESQAIAIQKLNPFYYRYYRCFKGEPTEIAIHWLEEPAKQQLKDLCRFFRQQNINH